MSQVDAGAAASLSTPWLTDKSPSLPGPPGARGACSAENELLCWTRAIGLILIVYN